MNRTITFLLLAMGAGAAFAQTAPVTGTDAAIAAAEIPEVRRYTTEIIIFAYGQNVSGGSEIFVPDVPPADLLSDDALSSIPEIIEEPEAAIADRGFNDQRKFELVMLEESDFQLVDEYDRLRRLDAYRPLLHFGWTQPTYPEDETEVRPLSSFVTPPEGLAGEISLYLSRYLHLAIDLQLDAPESATGTRAANNRGYASSDYDSDARADYPIRYRIKEDRIFRNGELRYFDHPKFGVLAKITRLEEAEESVEALEDVVPLDGELLGE